MEIRSRSGKILLSINSDTLVGADLSWTDLSRAKLRKTNLRQAILCKTDLTSANLSYADLYKANLNEATLKWAVLLKANLRNANLRNANLREANLRWASLCEANLNGADLRDTDLRNADLKNVDLRNADLNGAYLDGAKLWNVKFGPRSIVPPSGSFVAWKKGRNEEIIKIKIPSWARRTFCLTNRKCRAEYVITLEIEDKNRHPLKECRGGYDIETIYRVGKCTAPDKYDPDERIHCSHGIHFFLTREEAEAW
ncbi:MAG: hypothetical protein DRP65_10880 [Planctomycetota bacterium]|mgnify:CR=1 FL=1|nr:MAG: hypothetical protein DRP65_10880 [Planctomycetota bacterium]